MIRPLRQHHCRIVITLGVLLPITFAVGIAARKPAPIMDSLPHGLVAAAAPEPFAAMEWERADLFVKSPIRIRLLRGNTNSGRFAVELSAAKNFVKPDLMVYWVAGSPNPTNALPDDAQLLGAFSSSAPLPLPAGTGIQTGALVLYSLADGEIVDVSTAIDLEKN